MSTENKTPEAKSTPASTAKPSVTKITPERVECELQELEWKEGKKSKKVINVSPKNAANSYMAIGEPDTMEIVDGWTREKAGRQALIRAKSVDIAKVKAMLDARVKGENGGILGYLYTKEYTAATLPANLAKFENIDDQLKRAGNEDDAPICTIQGQNIYRINSFSTVKSDEVFNQFIKHDNKAAISTYAKARNAAAAELTA